MRMEQKQKGRPNTGQVPCEPKLLYVATSLLFASMIQYIKSKHDCSHGNSLTHQVVAVACNDVASQVN